EAPLFLILVECWLGGDTPYVISQQNPEAWGYTDKACLRRLSKTDFYQAHNDFCQTNSVLVSGSRSSNGV
ncbi:hypothetical protein, partial [Laspinema olomoucense]|uniref:hypothetical protein n=1 Tax=Laspinema olomoucense TaxID=3231600 RepID=UPI0021BAFA4B